MQALTPRQRNFVLAYVHNPQATGTKLCQMAGYSGGQTGTVWRSSASRMLRSPAIIAGINEVLGKTYRGRGAAIAQDVMLAIAQDAKHPQQLKAALALADRGGFGAMSEQRVTVEHRDQTSEAIIARIGGALRRLGLDDPLRVAIEAKLLGKPMEVIDVEPDADAVDQGRAVAGPQGGGAGGGTDAATARAAGPAGSDLDRDGTV
jgi:phage terminase small subunit